MTRVAVVHDYLSQFGGAERVALALADAFDAPIYTSLYQPELTFEEFREHDVRTSFLQKLVPQGKFRFAAPLMASAFGRMDLSAYDTVLVSSSGFAHHIKHPNAYVYCHTPPRFIYDADEYFNNDMLKTVTKPFMNWLRHADQKSAAQHPHYAANSARTAERIHEVYRRDAEVIYPPIATQHLPATPQRATGVNQRALIVARLQPYKRVDLAIKACEKAGVPLTIAGSGIEESRLRAMAHGDVTFLGRVPDAELAQLFTTHSVVLAPGTEDFGFAPIEANYAGLPVVARAAGGALETVQDGVTGQLVDSDEVDDWSSAISEALAGDWDSEALRAATTPFQMPAFVEAIKSWISPENRD